MGNYSINTRTNDFNECVENILQTDFKKYEIILAERDNYSDNIKV